MIISTISKKVKYNLLIIFNNIYIICLLFSKQVDYWVFLIRCLLKYSTYQFKISILGTLIYVINIVFMYFNKYI